MNQTTRPDAVRRIFHVTRGQHRQLHQPPRCRSLMEQIETGLTQHKPRSTRDEGTFLVDSRQAVGTIGSREPASRPAPRSFQAKPNYRSLNCPAPQRAERAPNRVDILYTTVCHCSFASRSDQELHPLNTGVIKTQIPPFIAFRYLNLSSLLVIRSFLSINQSS
jgi:hypothetical protein